MQISKEQFDRLRKLITDAYDVSTMDRADFGHIFSEKDDPLPTIEKEVHSFIKKRTFLWRHTWQLPPLRKALEILLSVEKG